MRWNLICFDLDNTLFDHEKAFEKAIRSCFREFIRAGKIKAPCCDEAFVAEWFRVFKENSDRFWAKFETGKLTKQQYRRLRFQKTMESYEIPASPFMADAFHTCYDQSILRFITFYPGVESLLHHLTERNIDVGVITNGNEFIQRKKAETLGLFRWVEEKRFFVSERFRAPKPEPIMFQAARRTQKHPHKRPLFIGDSWQHDVLGAVRAGWEAIFLNRFQLSYQSLPHLLAVCETFCDAAVTIRSHLR